MWANRGIHTLSRLHKNNAKRGPHYWYETITCVLRFLCDETRCMVSTPNGNQNNCLSNLYTSLYCHLAIITKHHISSLTMRSFTSVVVWLVDILTVALVDRAVFRPNIVRHWRVYFFGDGSWLVTSRVSPQQYFICNRNACSSFGISVVVHVVLILFLLEALKDSFRVYDSRL